MSIDSEMKCSFQRRHRRQNSNGLAPIDLRITIGKARSEMATGVFCPAAYWPDGAKKMVLPANKKLHVEDYDADAVQEHNKNLRQFRDDVKEAYRRLRRPDLNGPLVPVSVGEVRGAVRGPKAQKKATPPPPPAVRLLHKTALLFLATQQAMPEASRPAPATIASYKARCNTLSRYLDAIELPETTIEEVDIPWCRRFERWLLSSMSARSMRKQINYLQMVADFAVNEGWLTTKAIHGYKYQAKLEPIIPVSLSRHEVARLERALPDLNDASRRAVTGWLFCCYSGLSWTDYCRFAAAPADFLHMEDGICWLRMVRQKMKRRKPQGFSVPLFDNAAELLLRWRGCLPYGWGNNVNELLHQVEAELGISKSLTTKLARATFSQLKRDEGYSDEAVAAMMGDTVSVMNRHYSKTSERRIAQETTEIRNRGTMRAA